jgi:hypothetical protein
VRLDGLLKTEVQKYRAATFADNTKKTYQSHLRSYLTFCEEMEIVPVPASEQVVAQYAAYLARRGLAPSSVRQYLNIIRILHLESGVNHPYKDSWLVTTTLKGIDRIKGCAPNRKTPISPQVLLDIHHAMNLSCVKDCIFWAACLVMFFGLLRKSNLFQDNGSFSAERQLTKGDFVLNDENSVTVLVRWSKTIQRKEKTLKIGLPLLADHPLCPVTAVRGMFTALGPGCPASQAFPMRGSDFNKRLRALTSHISGDFSSHSFRRGGATWSLMCGVPSEVVKLMGDWKSTCYLHYLDQIPDNVIDRYRLLCAQKLFRDDRSTQPSLLDLGGTDGRLIP